jgi:hypothetical protein
MEIDVLPVAYGLVAQVNGVGVGGVVSEPELTVIVTSS